MKILYDVLERDSGNEADNQTRPDTSIEPPRYPLQTKKIGKICKIVDF
jgi:hypothetical protein